MKKPGEMLGDAFKTIKGQDIASMVEDFTSEVALVVEGISEDQERLAAENKALKEKMNTLTNRVSEMERTYKKTSKTTFVRQITWLVGVIGFVLIALYVLKIIAS